LKVITAVTIELMVFLGRDAMYYGRQVPSFRRNVLPESTMSFSTQNMEAVSISEIEFLPVKTDIMALKTLRSILNEFFIPHAGLYEEVTYIVEQRRSAGRNWHVRTF
jgi:hypothetical protein